ncbi:hypothetical protein ACFV5G_40505, partial [Streptomyces sp. NPDC059766]
MQIFGVDIGGSGIKGAPVDLDMGDLAQERCKVLTPHPGAPAGVPPPGEPRGGRSQKKKQPPHRLVQGGG